MLINPFRFDTGGGPTDGAFTILQGTTVMSSSETTKTLTEGTDFTLESGIASDEWFFMITNTHQMGMGRTSGGGNQEPEHYATHVTYSGDNVVLNREVTQSVDNRVDWQIVQFTGGGGSNEIKVREKGTTTLGVATTSANVALPGSVVTDGDVVPFITGASTTSSVRGRPHEGFFFTNVTGGNAVFQRGVSDYAATVSYALVEFTGSDWTVNRAAISGRATQNSTESLGFTLSNLTNTMSHIQYGWDLDGNCGLDDQGKQCWLTSTTQAQFISQTSNQIGNEEWVIWCMENPNIDVTRYNGLMSGTGEEEVADVTITAVTSLDKTMLAGISNDSSGSGTASPRGTINYRLTSTTNLRLTQSDNGVDNNYRIEVVELP